MSGIDPIFLYSETSETPMEVAYTCIFDPTSAPEGYSFDAVRTHVAERVPTLVPFRRRLMSVPLGIDHPRWVDDPDFDLDNHVHRVALPDPGGQAELSEMVAQVMSRPLAQEQPPWEMHVIEGLANGRIGLIAKVHHAVIDGVGGAELLAQFLDLGPEGREVPEDGPPWRPSKLPTSAQLVADALSNMWNSPVRTWRAAREVGRTAFRLASLAADSGAGPLSVPVGAPATFETPVGADRAVAFARLDLGQVQRLKKRFGMTVNDVVLAICSGALREHLGESGGGSESPLVAVVPVSLPAQAESADQGNRLSAMFVPLSNDLELPLDRLDAVAANCASTKAQERAVGYGSVASALTDAVPPLLARPFIRLGLLAGAMRRLGTANLLVSNVPGPTFPLFFAGMRLEAVHPLGPVVDGIALNITVQTYLDSLFVGINACVAAVPDPSALGRAMERELGQLDGAAATQDDEVEGPERVEPVVAPPRAVTYSASRRPTPTRHGTATTPAPRHRPAKVT